MKVSMIGLVLLTMSGCAGTMLDGRLCTIATDADAQKDIKTIIEAVADESKKKEVELGLKVAKLGSTALCEAARVNAVQKETK